MNTAKIEYMRTGGKALGAIKGALQRFVTPTMTFDAIEAEAQRLIAAAGFKPSFSTVPGYHWATCIMKNDEMCHGIPVGKYVDNGDIITIDLGLISNGYHLDTTITFAVGEVAESTRLFLSRGQDILTNAISQAKVKNTIYDVSLVMEKGLKKYGYGIVYQLTGHGIGEELHMDPAIPCFTQRSDKKRHFVEGQTVAIEVMYSAGNPKLVVDKDGWTYRTADGSLAGMFEETVLITKNGPEVLTPLA